MSELIRLEQKLDKGFKTICLEPIENSSLSWRAKGLHTYLISRPPGWKLWYADLEQRSTEGKTAIGTAVKELKAAGYLRIDKLRDENQRVIGSRWTVAQTPSLLLSMDEPHPDSPDTDKPNTDGPDTVNQLHSSKNLVVSNTLTKKEEVYLSKKGGELKGDKLTWFNEFMDAFDYKRGRAAAADSWLDIKNLTRELVDEIVAGAKRECARRATLRPDQTAKMAQGWLTDRRWEDEHVETGRSRASGGADSDVYERGLQERKDKAELARKKIEGEKESRDES